MIDNKMTPSKPIGRVLEEAGFINQDQVNVALSVQKTGSMMLGEVLQDLDFVTANEIAEAVAQQNHLEFVDLSTKIPSPDALKVIPYEIALSRNILPLTVSETEIIVAAEDVNDITTIDYIRKVSGKKVTFRVADKASISRYIEIFYYQLKSPIEEKIKDIVKAVKEKKEIEVPVLVELILNNAIKDRVTDIHINPENSATHIFFRIDGVLKYYYSLPSSLHSEVCTRLKIISELDISEQRKPQDGSFSYTFLNEIFDLRISTIPTNHGENIVMRLLGKGSSLFSLSHLGLTEENVKKIERSFTKPYGIILVVGPTGSGKTTTLYSALRKVDSLKKNVMTIEDPIEYKFTFIKQTQLNIKAGYNFNSAIKAFMRQDPDVILVGEIRDAETAELAIRASITGHLVLSTLHTNNAIGTIPRLEDLDVPPYLIASGLLSIIAQRLIRKLCNECKEKVEHTFDELIEMGISHDILKEYSDFSIYKACGCDSCNNTGYSGREVIVEIFELDAELENLITNKASVLEITNVAKKNGMKMMKDDGHIKILKGITTFEEIDRTVD